MDWKEKLHIYIPGTYVCPRYKISQIFRERNKNILNKYENPVQKAARTDDGLNKIEKERKIDTLNPKPIWNILFFHMYNLFIHLYEKEREREKVWILNFTWQIPWFELV